MKYYDIMFIIIVFWLGSDKPPGLLLFHIRFTSFHIHASLLTFFCFMVLFHSCCSHVRMFGKILVHEYHISYGHTEWNLFISRGEIVLYLVEASPIKS